MDLFELLLRLQHVLPLQFKADPIVMVSKKYSKLPSIPYQEPHNQILFTNPSARAGYDTRSIFFKRSLAGLNSEFSFSLTSCLTKAEEPSLPYYLPIAEGKIIGFIHFPRVLVLCEMQSVLSRN